MNARRNGAFTFVEVVIAIFVICVALAPILWFFGSSSRSTRVTINEVNASNIASEILESIQGIPFELLDFYDGPITQQLTQAAFMRARAAGITVTLPQKPTPEWVYHLKMEPVQLEKTYLPETAEPLKDAADKASRLMRIQVTIQWPEGGRLQELKLVTAKGYGS